MDVPVLVGVLCEGSFMIHFDWAVIQDSMIASLAPLFRLPFPFLVAPREMEDPEPELGG